MSQPLLNHSVSPNLSRTKSNSSNASLFTAAGIFSTITFSWVGPFLDVCKKRSLDLDDVPLLDDKDRASCVLPKLKAYLDEQSSSDQSKHPRNSSTGQYDAVTVLKLAKALVLSTWKLILVTAIFALVRTVASYVGPYLIEYFVEYLNGSQRSTNNGYLLILAFIVAQLLEGLSSRHLSFRSQQVGLRVRAALVAIIYQKGLTLSSKSRQSSSSGEMINIVSIDAECVSDFSSSMHEIWLLPVQVSLALYILYSALGMAAFAALAATILVMLANIPLGGIERNYREKLMDSKDARIMSTSELLRNMRILKLHGWEMMFLSKIMVLREEEMNWLKKYVYTSSMLGSVYFGAPAFVAVVTFGTCVILGIPLQSGKVLTAMATFRQLQEPIYHIPDAISTMVQSRVSLNRILSFLRLEELPNDIVLKLPRDSHTKLSIEVSNGCFSWDTSSLVPTISDVNLRIEQGMRVAICGAVGSGKSSLISCILGEIPKLSGEVQTYGNIAYVSQSPWIQSGKIVDNILFGKEMDKERYEMVIEACALKKDIESMPFGDQTVIGERGINLSGGQKQRLQIARALYHDADIFLFDDPFSAVDAHTGSYLLKECLLGFLASKTVVYVTHHVDFLPTADLILVMKDGRIVNAGKYTEILDSGKEFADLVDSHKDALSSLNTVEITNGTSGSTNLANDNSSSMICAGEEIDHDKSQLKEDIKREKGRVGLSVYWKYITMAYGGAFVPLIVLCHIVFQVLQICGNYWIAWATPISGEVKPPVSILKMINIYLALALISSLFLLMRSHFLVTAGCKTAVMLFDKMHQCIFRAPMSFFDSTPSGRILSRASNDQSAVDSRIFDLMGHLLFPNIELLGSIVLISQVAWPVFIIFIPTIIASLWYKQYYVDGARELQRLNGVQEAPLIQHIAETIAGTTIIRTFYKEGQFISSTNHLIDSLSRPTLCSTATMEWLSFRLDILSSIIFSFALTLLVTLPASVIDPKMAGLAVTYGLSLNVLQGWAILILCSLENRMVAVERILQYTTIPAEPPLKTEGNILNSHWPSKGDIELRDLSVRYAPQLPYVLKGLTCTFLGGMRTGIVGRTGSGKSTLIQSLFRIVDPNIGQVLTDGIDICTVGLYDLRTRLSIIPQDPVMFKGTVRGNLDPLGEYTDEQIWEALDSCHLGEEVRKNELKLDYAVTENGENWSIGQRQLVCLGRILLKKSKILVLDEATSSVDPTTDNMIQKTIRKQFDKSTVITVAHRITSVLDSDMVLVLDDGEYGI
ncbi:hypothetical protein BRADI_4g39174v3 [Brachypodium distachyon]|uniref:ABC transporter C family member 13 n=1 Tax=Brachypodium distachyon TaxID=15368 RepID=A0A2K2CT78_BRADI|nr:hypothetical protein BRADI_4g39174v3 [Brachypodium distachyon]